MSPLRGSGFMAWSRATKRPSLLDYCFHAAGPGFTYTHFDTLDGKAIGARQRAHLYGFFSDLGNYGYYWSGTEYNGYYAWYRSWYYGHGTIEANYYDKRSGFGVRCLRDM